MDNNDARKNIVSAQESMLLMVERVVDAKINNFGVTSSVIGVVVSNPVGNICDVKIIDDVYQCIIQEHLIHWIQKDDIVIVQDLHNNKRKMLITGKTGSIASGAQLVFEDARAAGNYVSGVDGAFDSDGNNIGYFIVDSDNYGMSGRTGKNRTVISFTDKQVIEFDSSNLYPHITVIDSDGFVVPSSVQYKNDGYRIAITLNSVISGKIILS